MSPRMILRSTLIFTVSRIPFQSPGGAHGPQGMGRGDGAGGGAEGPTGSRCVSANGSRIPHTIHMGLQVFSLWATNPGRQLKLRPMRHSWGGAKRLLSNCCHPQLGRPVPHAVPHSWFDLVASLTLRPRGYVGRDLLWFQVPVSSRACALA